MGAYELVVGERLGPARDVELLGVVPQVGRAVQVPHGDEDVRPRQQRDLLVRAALSEG